MTTPKTIPRTDIQVNASQQDVIRTLAAQYSHMDQGEARTALERLHNPVWTNDELMERFELSHFEPPFVHVIRKTDSVRGTVAYIDSPRLYFAFQPEENDDAGTPGV
jgi:hypothetical protein